MNLLKSMINIIFKNNTMIRILAIELLLNTILILVSSMIKSLLKNWWCALTVLEPCSVCRELKRVENLWSRARLTVVPEFRPIRNKTRLCAWCRPTCIRTAFLVKGTFIVTFASVEAIGYCSGQRTMSTFAWKYYKEIMIKTCEMLVMVSDS
jgi:hypothetical protein